MLRGACGVGVAVLLLLATGQQSVYVIIICMKICKSLVAKVAQSATLECYSQFRIRIRFALLWVILLLLLFNMFKQLYPFPFFLLAFIPFYIELKAEILVERRK